MRPTARKDARRDSGAAGAGSRGQETLAAILTAAAEIATKDGLDQLSMRRLAAAVGMSKSGLYAHFGSKQELQVATIDYFLEVFDAKVVRGPPDDPDGGLGGLLDRWLKFFENRVFPGGCFIISSSVEFASRRGPVRDALAAAVDLEIAVLERAVRRANEGAEPHAERDVSQTTFELHSILMEAHALFEVKKDPVVFERARAAIHRLVGDLEGASDTHRPRLE